MAAFDVILAVLLTLLGVAILAILIAACTRRKNETQVSRYASEQSAVLLDYEDGVNTLRQKKVKGGSRCLLSTESVSATSLKGPSASTLGIIPSDPALTQAPASRKPSTKSLREPLSGNAGRITRTIGPIMQFSAPIPGATGPIKLSQRTLVQTPGSIVQFTGSSGDPSEACSRVGSKVEMQSHGKGGPAPTAISCLQPVTEAICPSSSRLIISQKTPRPAAYCIPAITVPAKPRPPIILRQDTVHVAVPICCTDGGPPKKTDSKAQMTKQGSAVFPQVCRDSLKKNRGSLKCECGAPKRCDSPHESRSGLLECEAGEREKKCAGGVLKRRESQIINQIAIPRRLESQVRFATGLENEIAAEALWCEPPPICRNRESLMRKNEEGILKRQDSQRPKSKECPQEPQERGAAPPPGPPPPEAPPPGPPPRP